MTSAAMEKGRFDVEGFSEAILCTSAKWSNNISIDSEGK